MIVRKSTSSFGPRFKGKTLDGVVKSISDIEKALEAQAAAAKRGESSIDDLKATLLALQRVQDQLKDQAGLIGQYDKLSKQIETTASRVTSSAKAFAEYKDKLDKAGTATDYQTGKLIKLATASERSQTTLLKQRTDQEALATVLRDSGIQMDKLGEAENRVRQSAAQLGVTINRTQQAISTYSEDVRKARVAEKSLSEEQTFQQKLTDAAKLNKAGEYVRFWTEALNAADATEKQTQINAALRKTADEAVAAARGYKTLGTATKALAGPSAGLREVIQGILNPSQQARSTLAGLEEEVRKVGAAATAVKGPITGYREQVAGLVAAQKEVGRQATLVDSFSRQIAVLKQARTEYVAARATVLQYAQAMRNSNVENDQLAASLRNAQTALGAAQRNLQTQIGTARELRTSMREAGIATNDLVGAQTRLTGVAQGTNGALKTLSTAHRRYGDAVNSTHESHTLFSSSGRTTLSLIQRIRGEVLSLMAAYVGLYGVISGTGKVIDAFNTKQRIQNQLAITVGSDSAKIAEEWAYLEGQANRLGVSLDVLGEGYAKFLASSIGTKVNKQDMRFIFETFTEVGRVAGVTRDDMDGVFKALGQIMSKGKIQSEELRGQLADRLFGVFGTAKEALKDMFPDFDKALKEGKVTSDFLLKISEAYGKLVAGQLPTATKSLQANQERLNTEIFKFKNMVAEAGFADEYGKLIKTLTEFFGSDDGTKFARDLSDGLSIVVQGLRWMVENLEIVKSVLYAAFAVYGAKLIAGMGVGLGKLTKDVGGLNTSLEVSNGKWGALANMVTKFFYAFQAGIVGWAIGKILYEKFAVVREVSVAMVIAFQSAWRMIKFGAQVLWEEIPNIFMDGLGVLGNGLTYWFRGILTMFQAGARALGRSDLAGNIGKAIDALTFKMNRTGNRTKQLTEELKSDLARIKEIGVEMMAEVQNPGSTKSKVKPGAVATKPSGMLNVGTPGKDKDAEKRLKLKEQIEAELQAIDAKIERQEKDSLTSRLAAIDDTYGKLLKKIAKLGGDEAKALSSKLSTDIEALKLQETRKFNTALFKEQTDLQRKLEQVDAQIGRSNKTDLDARLKAVQDSHEQTYRDIQEFRDKLLADKRPTVAADEMKARLDVGVIALKNIERQKYFEDAVNAVLDERKAKLDLIAVQEKTGLLSSIQARERAAQVVSETQPKIEQLVATGLEYVDVMIKAAEAAGRSTVALDTVKAKLIEARESAKGLRVDFINAAQVNEMLATGATSAFGTMAQAISDAVFGVNTWKNAIMATRNAFLSFAADFLMSLGKMILKQALLNALQKATEGSTGGFGGMISTAVNAMLKHSGGVVGNGGASRMAHASWFANAPRFHGGGIPGLSANEYPAILKKNEEVLTESDPRNVLNGGKTGSQTSPMGLKIINMIDSGSVVSEGLATREGEKSIFNFIRANRVGLKQILA